MISKDSKHFLIHVMEKEDEDLLIKGTLSINEEIEKMNSLLSLEKMNVTIVIYGKNTDDVSKVIGRYRQLNDMGFSNVYVYLGGLFEWLLLQEIYGNDEIKTNNICKKNILDYKPARSL
jgi:rhodanese-related sulfurtransferase